MNSYRAMLNRAGGALIGLAFVLAPGVFVSLPGQAPRPVADSPEEFATRYIETVRQGDFAALAALMHDDALADVKAAFGRLIANGDPWGFVEEFDVADEAEYLRLTPAQVFERFIRLAIDDHDLEALRTSTFTVLRQEPGPEPDVVYVRYSVRLDPRSLLDCDPDDDECDLAETCADIEQDCDDLTESLYHEDAIPLKRQDGEWRAMLTMSLSAFFQFFTVEESL